MNIPDYSIRKASKSDAEGIAFVHVKSWQTSYVGIIDQVFLDNINYDKRLASRKEILKSKSTLHLVATLDEQIIGFADAGTIRPESCVEEFETKKASIGEIYAIYLLEEHKGEGLGKAFFKRCRLWFNRHGFVSFVAWVLADNMRARRFYESEGGKLIDEMTRNIGDKAYKQYCYLFTILE